MKRNQDLFNLKMTWFDFFLKNLYANCEVCMLTFSMLVTFSQSDVERVHEDARSHNEKWLKSPEQLGQILQHVQ